MSAITPMANTTLIADFGLICGLLKRSMKWREPCYRIPCNSRDVPEQDVGISEPGTAGKKPRVVMVGLDAYTLDFVNQNLERLPVMKRLLQRHGVRSLTAPGGLLSASVWSTFAAARQPGEHGHFYPFQWRPETMNFRRSSITPTPADMDFDPFWRKMARAGKRVIAFDIGVPLDPVGAPCVEIYNWANQSSGAALSSDPALLKEIRRQFGRRPIGKEVPVPKKIERSRAIRDSLVASIDVLLLS